MCGWSRHPHRASGVRCTWGPPHYFCTSWLPFYPVRAKLTSPFFTFYARPPFCFHSGARWGPSFVVQKGRRSVPEAGKPATGPPWALADRFSRAGNKVGTLLRNPPPVGGGDLWPRSRGNCCRSDALRGVGRGRGPEHTDLGPEAGRDIKRQGADFLSRSPVFLSPLARLPFLSHHFFIGHRQTPGGWFMVRGGPGRRPP